MTDDVRNENDLGAEGLTCIGDHIETVFVAETDLPTKIGTFILRAYRSHGHLRSFEPVALIYGQVLGQASVPVRVHDQCLTSEVFGSLKCDCKEQLEYAKQYAVDQQGGVVIYMPQEGRGIGLANKVKAYALQQHESVDTVDANRILGYADDYRAYEPVKTILDDLKIQSIALLTNNPRKVEKLTQLGIDITACIPVVMPVGVHNRDYLHAKKHRMNHQLGPQSSSSSSKPKTFDIDVRIKSVSVCDSCDCGDHDSMIRHSSSLEKI